MSRVHKFEGMHELNTTMSEEQVLGVAEAKFQAPVRITFHRAQFFQYSSVGPAFSSELYVSAGLHALRWFTFDVLELSSKLHCGSFERALCHGKSTVWNEVQCLTCSCEDPKSQLGLCSGLVLFKKPTPQHPCHTNYAMRMIGSAAGHGLYYGRDGADCGPRSAADVHGKQGKGTWSRKISQCKHEVP
ncbi:hypothetical protein BDY19DRAFT_185294 [Irpex rosettiformis]|uniref:Uncharacterized protein n=1 Tax=Irpex rosettiformis TaxID=378272 RepID=A0ACB8U1I4_9APHY|nr:hypothetical protein BDY19DRAFT_185294 [Irpex rosettiformis]